MSRLSNHHRELNECGEGKCSVPMFAGGGPAGFCDKPAFGTRPNAPITTRWDGFSYRDDGLYAGYVPGLACRMHGGPSTRVFKDGNAWCAVRSDFINLQESTAGFGDSPEAARAELGE
jgi:hypothetical protein